MLIYRCEQENNEGRQAMLQKLLLAITATFTLNLFLEIRSPANNQPAVKVYIAEIPTIAPLNALD